MWFTKTFNNVTYDSQVYTIYDVNLIQQQVASGYKIKLWVYLQQGKVKCFKINIVQFKQMAAVF